MIADSRATVADDGIDLLALWRVLWNFKYLIAAVSISFGLIAVWLALTATEVFRAEVVVTEARESALGGGGVGLSGQLGGLAGLAGINLGGLTGAGASQEAKAVLKSRRLVQEFIQRYKLLPELFPESDKPRSLWLGVRDFRDKVLEIKDDVRSGVTTIAIDWTDPSVAARWANDFVALGNELMRAKARDEAEKNIAYLKSQIERTNVVEVQRVMYSIIESETKKLMLANARAEYAFTVVDPAVTPEVRISPKRTLMVLFGLVLGGVVGAIAAFVLNLVRNQRLTQPD